MLDAAGTWYEMTSGGRLMVIKAASQRLAPKLLVDTHQGAQARCERTPGAHTAEGLSQAAETYAPQQAWQMLGRKCFMPMLSSGTWQLPGPGG